MRISIACPLLEARPVDGERLAGRDPDLLAHDVDPGDELRHRMLDLETAVDLDEVERAVRTDEELERACVAVADRLARARDRRLHCLSCLRIERRRRRFLDELLMSPLDRALALSQRQHATGSVAEHLNLDVTSGRDELLDVDRAVPERSLRLGARPGEGVFELVFREDEPHAFPSTSRRCFKQDWKAGGCSRAAQRLRPDLTVGARNQRDARLAQRLLRAHLVAHLLDDVRRRPDEDEIVVHTRAHEFGVLGEEPIAGMDRVAVRRLRGGDDVRDLQVALRGRRGADAHRVVGQPHMERIAVGRGVDGDSLDPELVRSTDHPDGDLASVGDQHPIEHGHEP